MDRRYGSQVPTFQHVGTYESSKGPTAVEAFGEMGVEFMPAQEMELELMLARDADGRAAARTLAIAKPRQNGKSFAARHYAVWCADVLDMHVLYSAHHGRTARDAFKYILAMLDMSVSEDLHNDVVEVYRAAGSESISFRSGGSIEFQTRSTSGARGGTFDVIIIDEAQEYTSAQQSAMSPVTIAAEHADPQTILLGTPPGPTCPGDVFRRMHDRAHAGETDAWWLEWSVDEVGDVADVDRWYATNPALGYRIREDVFASKLDEMDAESFARELLGWWSPSANGPERVFTPQEWDACATEDEPAGDVCYGVKIAPDGSEAALCACWRGETPHFELVDYRDSRKGLAWLSDWLDERADRCAMLAVDGRNAEALTSRLGSYTGNMLHVMRTGDAIAASALLVEGIRSRSVTHYGQAELDKQAYEACRRKVGRDAWCIGGERSTAIEAAACALWAATNAKRNPGKKMRLI